MQSYLAPIFEKRRELEKDPQAIDDLLAKGSEKAREVAAVTMQEVRSAIGLL
jgi:tryptophanyl-tRNA synthetase